jgi:hypothetical protein
VGSLGSQEESQVGSQDSPEKCGDKCKVGSLGSQAESKMGSQDSPEECEVGWYPYLETLRDYHRIALTFCDATRDVQFSRSNHAPGRKTSEFVEAQKLIAQQNYEEDIMHCPHVARIAAFQRKSMIKFDKGADTWKKNEFDVQDLFYPTTIVGCCQEGDSGRIKTRCC